MDLQNTIAAFIQRCTQHAVSVKSKHYSISIIHPDWLLSNLVASDPKPERSPSNFHSICKWHDSADAPKQFK